MSRFTSKLRFSLEEMSEELENNDAASDDTIVDVGGDDEPLVDDVQADDAVADDAADDVVDEQELPAVVSADDVIVDTTDSVENAIAEADDAEEAVDENIEQSEELEEAAEGLESIRDLMIEAQQRGGLSLQAARMANIAVESYAARIGIQSAIMPSMESFGGSSTRLRATNLSVESIGDWIKKAWETLKAIVVKIATNIYNYFEKLFNASKALERRAEKLKNFKASGKPKEATIKSKGLAKKIAIGTKADMSPSTGIALFSKTALGYVGDANSASDSLGQCIEALKSYMSGGSIDGLNQAVDAATKSIKDGPQHQFVLPGNVKPTPVEIKWDKLGIRLGYTKLERTENYSKVSDEASVPTMSVESINLVGREISVIGKAIDSALVFSNKYKKTSEKLKAIKTLSEREIPESENGRVNEVFSLIRFMSTVYARETAKICSHLTSTAFAYVQLAERSALQYSSNK